MKTSAFLWTAVVAAVLPWTAIAQTDLNKTPSRVVGQPTLNFRSANPNVVEGRSLYSPWAVVVDTTSTPNAIFVSDTFNNRVLGWRDAVTFQNGARADLILGQLDDQSTERLGPNGNASRSLGFTLPGALAIDSRGSLYIVDAGNNRILRFPKPFAADEQNRLPDLVIGQQNYTTGTANAGGVSETGIATASGSTIANSGLAFDPQGNLWFSDPFNHRILRYPKAALDAGTNRPAADLVLGQPDFRTNTAPPANSRLNKGELTTPSGIAVDSQGRVYVADANARVLVYTPPFINGKEASRLVGIWIQPPNTPFSNYESALTGAEGVAIMNDRLVVVDTTSSRILRYDPFSEWLPETEEIVSPPAKAVLGQTDFSGSRPNRSLSEPNATTIASPVSAFAVGDSLYVADTGNNRVLAFPSFGSGASATRVLGQVDFSRNSANIVEGRELWTFNGFNASGQADGGGVVVDSFSNPPRLYIADSYNNRILGYRDARRVRPNDPADIVIGQSDLSRSLVNAPQGSAEVQTDSGLFRPTGMAVDSNGDLFVADTGNGRVLRFPSPFEQTIAAGERRRANLVIGQRNFNERFTDASRFNMAAPFGVALTVERHLVVSDAAHNRVLFFRRPAGGDFTNGMGAERVFGQPDFNSTARVTAPNRMFSPRHIALDTDDRLYVADSGNNRVLIFDRVTSAPNDPQVAFPITGVTGAQSVWVSPLTGEIWVGVTRSNQAQRFPRFERLTLGIRTDYDIPLQTPLAMTQDAFGNLYVVEATNRVSIFYNGLKTQIAGNYAEKPLSPGSIGIVYPQTAGATFTGETVVFNSLPNPLPLPKELADIEVVLNDRPLPLYFVSPGQINYLVPFDVPESGTAELQVIRKSLGQILGASTVNLSRVSPALFTLDPSNPAGQLAAINVQDGTVNSPANAVARGQYISLYGTGMGPVQNPPAEGAATSGEARGVESIRVLIGDTAFVPQENIQYFGLAPGFVGLYQINVKIPENVAPRADVDVVVEVRSALTNRTFVPERIIRTTINVKP